MEKYDVIEVKQVWRLDTVDDSAKGYSEIRKTVGVSHRSL